MQNIYLKNYAIWLGGTLALFYLVSVFYYYLPFLDVLGVIVGTIVATVMTHKEQGSNIKFGKAIGPVLLIIAAFSVLGLIINIIQWGASDLMYFLPTFFTSVLMSMLGGTSVLLAVGTWYMFEKAGKPGWAMLVPIYNLVVMCQIGKKPGWWVVLFLIPIVNIVFLIMMLHGISTSFGKDSGFTVGLIFLRQIFFAILGFGDAEYDGVATVKNEAVIDNI